MVLLDEAEVYRRLMDDEYAELCHRLYESLTMTLEEAHCWISKVATLSLAEASSMTLEEVLGFLYELYGMDDTSAERPPERRNPATGLLAVTPVRHSPEHHERWHTAATGE